MSPRFLLAATLSCALSSARAQSPNVIAIISDDAGFADWGFMDPTTGATTDIPTPNLDALRATGTLFTNAYTAAVCSPSRAALVTGSYQQRIGYEYNINNLTGADAADGLHPDTVTIFDRMKGEGYTTGAIGKWHLGARDNASGLGNRPENMGVDEFFGIWKGSRNYTVGGVTGTGTLRETTAEPFSDTVLETAALWNGTNVTNTFGQGALDFIDRHYTDTDPFFLYVSFTSPHGPLHESPDFGNASIAGLSGNRKEYASMMLTMDKEIGRIVGKLDDPDGDSSDADSILGNTYILFINDNGGASSNASVNLPLRDFKGSVFEGGIRVPMLVTGPGVPVGGTYDKPVHSIDIVPTCVAAAGGTPPAGIDGVNLLPFIDGADPGDPHEAIIVRNETRVGLRTGDWKLVKTGRTQDWQLFDLASDISETTDLAAANSGVVADLEDMVTAYETGFDKPRHAPLNGSPDDINLNDRFVLAPTAGASLTFTSDLALVGAGLRNGDFNEDASTTDQRSFEETPSWYNLGGPQTAQATRTTGAEPSIDDSRNAVLSDNGTRRFAIDSGHTLAEGEVFQVTYWWRDASGWQDGVDRFQATLFTTDTDQIDGVRNEWFQKLSDLSTANLTYELQAHISAPAPAAVAGRRLFLLIDAVDGGTTGDFARLDNVTLNRGTATGGPPPVSLLNWSEASSWTDPDTAAADTLLFTDSFPGCVLDFPAVNGFSYRATNDMTRSTGLTFIANAIRCTGAFGGTTQQSATVDGNPVLLTESLEGAPPALALNATGAEFAFDIDLDLDLYHDGTVSGNGTASFTLNGTLGEYDSAPARGLTKSGESKLLIATAPTYTGPTLIEGGSLTLAAGVNWGATSGIAIGAGGTLGGNGTVDAPISGSGRIAPGESVGTLTATGDAALGSLFIEVDGANSDRFDVGGTLDIAGANLAIDDLGGGISEPAYVIASYGTLNGAFAHFTNLPHGYTVNYAYDVGGSTNHIALVSAPPVTPTLKLIDFDDGTNNGIHDSAILNGGFEANVGNPGDTLSFDQVEDWFSGGGNPNNVRDNFSAPTGGSWNAIIDLAGSRIPTLNTGYDFKTGDTFEASFDWRDASQWDRGPNRVALTLYTTVDNSAGGTVEDSVTVLSAASLTNEAYQRAQFHNLTLPASSDGNRLFFAITGENGGGSSNGFARIDNAYLALSSPSLLSPYDQWARITHGLEGSDAAFTADPEKGGLMNGIEFLTGLNPGAFDPTPLEVTSTGATTTVSFPFADAASSLTPIVQSSTDLIQWTDAIDGQDGVQIETEDNFYAPGLHQMSVEFPALAEETRLFRLAVSP